MKIGTIKGITIRLNISTLLIIALVGFSAASFYDQMVEGIGLVELILVGILNGVILLASILLHELSHSLMAQRYELNVTEIELYLFGGVSKIEEEPRTPKSEMIISVVGPATSLLIGGALFGLYFLPIAVPSFLVVTFFYSGLSNVILGIFNMIPAFPMDGGRVLRAFLWNRRDDIVSSTKSATTVSKFFGYGFMVLGFIQMILFFSFNAFWFILIGMFLNSSARRAYEQVVYENWLGQFKARDMVGNYGYAIPSHVLVNDAIINYFMPLKRSYFPVIEGPDVVGVIHIKDIKNIPYEARFNTPTGAVKRDVSELPNVNGDATGIEAMKQMRGVEQDPIIVVRREEDDQILGFIGNDEIVSAIKFAQMGIHQ